MKVALVHDVLNQLGGAEKVLKNFLQIWPDATIHTVFYDEEKTAGAFRGYNMELSDLNSYPLAHAHPRLFVTMLPKAFELFSFKDYDVVISDSSAFAKFANPKGKLHVSYIHTPTRFLWTEPDYLDSQDYPWLLKAFGKLFLPWLKKRDFLAAQRPQFLIANSVNVQGRIKSFYKRDSIVMPAPVDAEFFHPVGEKKDYYFTVSRLEPYKKIDVIVRAFNENGLPLKVAGTGTMLEQLKAMAKPNVEFVGRISDDELRKCYSEAKAFVFAAEEDAGIAVLEAQACGTPVIAYGKGGALETVVPGVTGEFFSEQTAGSLNEVLQRFDAGKYSAQALRDNALKYDNKIFQKKFKEFVEDKLFHFNDPRKIA